MIIKIFLLLVCFFVILISLKNHEDFIVNPIIDKTNNGIHSIVNPDIYDSFYGPQCFTTCLAEHVQKINWDIALEQDSKYSKENILQYNRDNIGQNYCHSANTYIDNKTDIKNCSSGECNISCGSDLYSHCENTLNFCKENSLNYLSSGAKLHTTNCSGNSDKCVDKYWKNIQTLKDIYDSKI